MQDKENKCYILSYTLIEGTKVLHVNAEILQNTPVDHKSLEQFQR